MRRGTSYQKVWAWKPWDQVRLFPRYFFVLKRTNERIV